MLNHMRWAFGTVLPEISANDHDGERSELRLECLVACKAIANIVIRLRFLQPTNRVFNTLNRPMASWPPASAGELRPLNALGIGAFINQPWEEATEREVVEHFALGSPAGSARISFAFPPERRTRPLQATSGYIGELVREKRALRGLITIQASPLAEGLWKLIVQVRNKSHPPSPAGHPHGSGALAAFMSTHLLLGSDEAEFISLMDPPDAMRPFAELCHNNGLWPVLIGARGERNMLLASPMVLNDYPAPGSRMNGDAFGETENGDALRFVKDFAVDDPPEPRHESRVLPFFDVTDNVSVHP